MGAKEIGLLDDWVLKIVFLLRQRLVKGPFLILDPVPFLPT